MHNGLCNILDVDETGKAVIEIPHLQQDYSFILNHWKKSDIQLSEIDNDLLNPDSEDRRYFLEKARLILLKFQVMVQKTVGGYLFFRGENDSVFATTYEKTRHFLHHYLFLRLVQINNGLL